MTPDANELATYYRFQALHWRRLALTYHQQLLAAKNHPEKHYGKTTLHRDPTGHAASASVDRERKQKES